MPTIKFPDDTVAVTPTASDILLLADQSDGNKAKDVLVSALITLFHTTPTFTGAVTLGTADVDAGSLTMIMGAQAGDPQFSIAISSDADGDVTLDADTGDVIMESATNRGWGVVNGTWVAGSMAGNFNVIEANGNDNETYFDTYNTGNLYTKLYFRKADSNTMGTLLPTDNGEYLCDFWFKGVNTGNAWDTGAAIRVKAVANAAAGGIATEMVFQTSLGGADQEMLCLNNDNTENIINRGAQDRDFRVASIGGANSFFVQGSDGFVGMGTNTPAFELDVVGNIGIDSIPDADHKSSGITATMTAGVTCAVGDLLYQNADGELYFVDADAAATMPGIFLAISAGTNGNPVTVLCLGYARDDTWTWTVGGLIYASTTGTTTNTLTQTAPAGDGDQVQVVGVATHADRMYFKPSLVLVEVVV